jgi:hypothetical protein
MVDLGAFWHGKRRPQRQFPRDGSFPGENRQFVITDFQGVITVWNPVIT